VKLLLSATRITSILPPFGGSEPLSAASRSRLVEYFFKTISALGAVEYSGTGHQNSNDIIKYGAVFMKFAGQVGPLTPVFACYSSKREDLMCAGESVMAGKH
jgi:hypothetical protein